MAYPHPPRLVLASASPRRRDLLEHLGIAFTVDPSDIDEIPFAGEEAAAFAERVSIDKAVATAQRHAHAPVLAADTVVELDGVILGKPVDRQDAASMLRRLASATHRVHSAVALAFNGRRSSLVDTAVVRFAPIDEAMIRWYVSTGEPMDKAGAYAVQGAGGVFVRAVEGSPHTVIGLPVHRLPELFAACGLSFFDLLSRPD